MISQPMMGKSDEEISKERILAVKKIEEMFSDSDVTVPYTLFDFGDKPPLFYLAKSLEVMSQCDGVYFMKGWENARGCRIEREAAEKYGIWVKEEV